MESFNFQMGGVYKMRILLSSSTYHYKPGGDHYHSTGLTIEVFYKALGKFGTIDVIGDHEKVEGREYDLLVSWPRNYRYLSDNNKFKKRICFLNAAEPRYLRNTLLQEAGRLGCKLSDSFYFSGINDADLYFLLGGQFNRDRYVEAGVPNHKILDFGYSTWDRIYYEKTNEKPIFIHFATSLGLRKGFWWAVEDFKKTDIDAELWCIGKVQKEKFWIDYANSIGNDRRIKLVGWVSYRSDEYFKIMEKADFLLFPTFGEGQAGTVIESMAYGVIPLTNKESGVPYFPLGEYVRGNSDIIKKAFSLDTESKKKLIYQGYSELENNYNNKKFIDFAAEEIRKLCI